MKLGRKAVVTDSRTLKLSDYFWKDNLPIPPSSVSWSKGITTWGMMLNGPDPNNPSTAPDGLGDCTIAGVGHACQVWSANISKELAVTDATILSYYEKWDGYVYNQPSTDNGGILLNVLNKWQKQKFDGQTLTGFAAVNVAEETEVEQAINLFGGCYIGLDVPDYIMEDLSPSKIWKLSNQDTQIDGGHCVFVTGYNKPADTIEFISWGSVYQMTRGFWNKYVDESYALLSPDWIGAKGSPAGFDLAQLTADLAAIK